jgi:2-oxoglutarate dehydrogenase E2 component (dihydrolipoamide succinyltransferase)
MPMFLSASSVRYKSVEVKTPPFAESITEGDVKWEKSVGDSVVVDEQIAEVETDKTSLPVNAPVSGVIEAIIVPDGEKVTAGSLLCKIDTEGSLPLSKDSHSNQLSQVEKDSDVLPTEPPTASIPEHPPTPQPMPEKPLAVAPSIEPSVILPRNEVQDRAEHRVKISRMRQRIAERLKEAQNTNAMLTTFNEVDMSILVEVRKTFKDEFFKKHNVKLGYMSAFVKAASFALKDQPVVNAVIEGSEIVYRDFVDISVAVATPKGLVVPVIRNVENMNYADIEREIHSLGIKAKEGSLAIEDMYGGTFTISNGGVFGSLYGTPIINPPQSAILGMHAIKDRPVAVNNKVEIRPMMYVALTYDHRLIDGREAVLFLRKIKSAVENPVVLLLDL